MKREFIDEPKKMEKEYLLGKKYWDMQDFKKATEHYANSIRFSGGHGINYENFRTYYELGLVLCAYGDYKGAVYCYSVAAYLDKEMQKEFKNQYSNFEDIEKLSRGWFKTLIVGYSWQFGHALLDGSDDIKKFPDWKKYVGGYRYFIKLYCDFVPFSYPDHMIDFYPREVVDFYMKSGIELAETALNLNDNNIEAMIEYLLYTSIPALKFD